MQHALSRFVNRDPAGFMNAEVGVGSVYFAQSLAGLAAESQGMGFLKKKRKALTPGESIARARKLMKAGRQAARNSVSAAGGGGGHFAYAARAAVAKAVGLPGAKDLKKLPKGLQKQLKRERAQVMRAVLNPGTANAPAPVIINPTQIAPSAPVADVISAPPVESFDQSSPGMEPVYDAAAPEFVEDGSAYEEAAGEEMSYADEGEYVEGDDVIVEEALEGQGMGFFNKIGKMIKRNKNTLGKVAGVAAVINPAIGAAIGTVAAAAQGGGTAANPIQPQPAPRKAPAPARRVVRKVAAPAPKISTPMLVVGGVAALALVVGMVRK